MYKCMWRRSNNGHGRCKTQKKHIHLDMLPYLSLYCYTTRGQVLSPSSCLFDECFLLVGQIGRNGDIEDNDEVFGGAVTLGATLSL